MENYSKTVDWTTFKGLVLSKSLNIKYVDTNLKAYELRAAYEDMVFLCTVKKTEVRNAYQIDYEDNFKMGCNTFSSTVAPFASKILSGKKLYTRAYGFHEPLAHGANASFDFTIPFMMTKLDGIEILGVEIGDNVSVYIVDTDGTNTPAYYQENLVLNQFGFNRNVAKDIYTIKSKYDSDLKKDMRVRFIYNSVSAKTIYINLDLHELK